MKSVEQARAEYLVALKRSVRARRSLIARSKQLKEARRVHIQVHTKNTRETYRRAKRVRARHYRAYKRAQAAKWSARARYATAKRIARRPLRVKALHVARSLLGVMEQGGNNRGEDVAKIIRGGGGNPSDAPPWCGYFVAYCYRQAGSKAVTWQWAAVRLMARAVGVRKTRRPKPGDIVRFTFDHTGLFERDNGNGTITTIEANTGLTGAVSDSKTGGDGVYRKVRPKSLVSDYLHVRF